VVGCCLVVEEVCVLPGPKGYASPYTPRILVRYAYVTSMCRAKILFPNFALFSNILLTASFVQNNAHFSNFMCYCFVYRKHKSKSWKS
jgi:hypothetical protein